MPNNHTRNTDGLKTYAASKSEAVKRRVDNAIRTLSLHNMPINFNSVAINANISKTTLYNTPEYRDRIESLRNTQMVSPPNRHKTNMTDKSKDTLLAAKNKCISELEAEVSRLSDILKRCYANEYEKF